MSCKVTSGIENSCEDVMRVGGLSKSFWVGYKSDLDTQISLAQSADVDTLDFGSYGGLYRFDGRKFAHSYSCSLAVGQGGTKSFTQTFVAKLLSKTTADDKTIKTLSLSDDIFIITEDNNQGFVVLGAGNGLTVTVSEMGTGTTGDSDTSTTITFSGNELTQPIRFALGAGYQATLDYLESREI
jgi:hypothetical protein